MSKFFLCLKNRIILYFASIIFIALIPYFIFYFINLNTKTYSISFECENISLIEDNFTYDNLNSIKEYYVKEREEEIASKGSTKKADYSSLDIDKVLNSYNIKEEDGAYILEIKQNIFTSQNACKKYFTKFLGNYNVDTSSINISTNEMNLFKVISISLLISFILITIVYLLIYFLKPSFFNLEIEYDNKILYRTIFHISYWKNQLNWFHNLKHLVLLSILFAIMLMVKLIPIPSGFSNLGLSLSYLVFSLIAMIYGPITGFIIGFFSDIFGYFIAPSAYGFYLPYTLNSMLAGLTYGICFYKTNISYTKCLMSRLIVNLFINVLLGSIWWSILNNFTYEQFRVYVLVTSLPKNLFYLLPQSLLQFLFLKFVSNPACQSNIIDQKQREYIRFL